MSQQSSTSAAFVKWRAALPHLLALLLGLLLTVIETYPLIGQIRDHLAGPADHHDPMSFVWNNWWIRHAIVDLRQKPYFTDYIATPFRLDLRLHTLGLLYGLVSIPLGSLLRPIALTNAQLLVTGALNSYAAFLLVRHWVCRSDVALILGAAVASVSATTFHLLAGRPSCGAVWTIAVATLCLIRLVEQPSVRRGLEFGTALVVMLVADQQLSIFGGVLMTAYLAGIATTRPNLLRQRTLLVPVVVALMMIAVPIRVLFIRPFFQTPGYTVPGPDEALHYSTPFTHLFIRAGFWRTYGLVLALGLLAAIGGIARGRRDRRVLFGLLCTLFGIVMTLGPRVSGTRIPLPFAAVRHLPGFAMFRAPYRFQIIAAFGLALAAAPVLARWLTSIGERSTRRSVLIAFALLLVGDAVARRWVIGFKTHEIVVDPIYETIRDTPGDFVLLEVPVGVRCGTDVIGRGDDLMLFQTIHGKRMINAYPSRLPLVALDYYRKSPALMFLANEQPPPGDIAADLDDQLRRLGVGVILVHPDRLDSGRYRAIMDLLRGRHDLEPIPAVGPSVGFRVVAPS